MSFPVQHFESFGNDDGLEHVTLVKKIAVQSILSQVFEQ